jgi:hypothetical protein
LVVAWRLALDWQAEVLTQLVMQLVILLVMLLAATRLAELRLAIIQQQPMPRHRTT